MLSEHTSHTTIEPGIAPARLRPAEESKPMEKPADADSVGNALLTCLLAIYPAVATLAMIVAGLFFSGATGGA